MASLPIHGKYDHASFHSLAEGFRHAHASHTFPCIGDSPFTCQSHNNNKQTVAIFCCQPIVWPVVAHIPVCSARRACHAMRSCAATSAMTTECSQPIVGVQGSESKLRVRAPQPARYICRFGFGSQRARLRLVSGQRPVAQGVARREASLPVLECCEMLLASMHHRQDEGYREMLF